MSVLLPIVLLEILAQCWYLDPLVNRKLNKCNFQKSNKFEHIFYHCVRWAGYWLLKSSWYSGGHLSILSHLQLNSGDMRLLWSTECVQKWESPLPGLVAECPTQSSMPFFPQQCHWKLKTLRWWKHGDEAQVPELPLGRVPPPSYWAR